MLYANKIALYFQRWDEWVESNRIVELNSEGLNLQKKLSAEHASSEPKSDEKEVIVKTAKFIISESKCL